MQAGNSVFTQLKQYHHFVKHHTETAQSYRGNLGVRFTCRTTTDNYEINKCQAITCCGNCDQLADFDDVSCKSVYRGNPRDLTVGGVTADTPTERQRVD